ncbi:MAG: hypothetical protein ACI906_001679 [Candidatus Latescibacterota bacterium]|jgi:hypothetical protein
MLILAGILLTSVSLLLSLRAGTRGALPAVVIAGLVAFALLGPGLGLAPIMGWIAVYQIERGEGFGKVVAGAVLPAAVFCLWMVFSVGDSQTLQSRSDEVVEQFEMLGMEMEPQALEGMIYMVLRVQPAVEFVSLLLTFLLAFRTAGLLAPRFQVEGLPSAPPMPLWRPWEELIWVMIGALAISLLGGGWLVDLALNLVVVMAVVYAMQGLAVLRFFAQRQGVPRAMELPFYLALLLVAGLAMMILAGVGLLDTWFDWRRLRPALPDEDEDEI